MSEAELDGAVTASDVASALLSQLGPMSAMKLQKLVYYVQATSLARDHVPAFDEDIQAWRDGPVVRSLYERHAGTREVSDVRDATDSHLDPRLWEIVIDVVDRYGPLEAEELSDISHREEPWRVTRGGLSPEVNSERPIPKALIESFYARQSRVTEKAIAASIGSAQLEGAEFSASDERVLRQFSVGEITREEALAALTSV